AHAHRLHPPRGRRSTMAAIGAAVSVPDAAPDLHLVAHQYEQLLHLLPPRTHAALPVHPAVVARCVFAHMLEAEAPPSEATITSLGRVVAADVEGADDAFRLVSTMRQKYGIALRLRSYSPVLAVIRRLARPTRSRPSWRPPLYRRKSPSSPCSLRSAQRSGTQTRCMSICTSCGELSAV
uniref:PROP1-like PPR domain-containing protein n=5 Tax=Aegilops tauschii subsp. strangulata TaxID=200361 RepID=A0A453RHW5_AEGTS